MATCPKCGDYLGKNHSCWGVRQRLGLLWTALLGALGGFLIPWMVVARPAEPLLGITVVLGAILALALRRYVRF